MTSARPLLTSITTWECIVLLLLLPVVVFPAGPQAILLLLIPFFWLLHFISGERLFPHTPFNLGLGLMALMLLVSLTVTFDYSLSLSKMAGILYGIALLMATSRLVRQRRQGIWWVFGLVLLAGVAIAVAGLLGVRWLEPFERLNALQALLPADMRSVPGAVGGVINENELAGTLAWITPLFIAALIGLPRAVPRYSRSLTVILTLATLLLTGTIIATQSRGGVLALMLSTTLVIALFVPKQWRLVVLVVAAVASLAWYFSYGSALDTLTPGVNAFGLTSRLEIWSRALVAIGDFPLTGVSVNGFRQILQVLYPTFIVTPVFDLGHAHNHLLQTALDLGLPGLVGYLSLWFLMAGMLTRNLRRLSHLHAEDHPYFALTAGLAGALTAGWTFGMLDSIALGARPGFIWWLVVALAGSSHYLVMYQLETAGRRRRRHVDAAVPPPAPEPEPAFVPQPVPEPISSPSNYPEERPRSRPRMRYRPPSDG